MTGSFWRLEEPVFDGEGNLVEGGLFDYQLEWWNLPNYYRLFVAGAGSGKTMTLCKRMIALALHNSGCPVVIVSPTFPVARTTVIPTLNDLLSGKSAIDKALRYRHNKSTHIFDLTYCLRGKTLRGQIHVRSGENPEHLKGANYSAAGIDEPFVQKQEMFEEVKARVRHPYAKKREINLTGTPEGMIGWGYELAEGELRKVHDVGIVRASSMQNKAVPPDWVEGLEASWDEKLRRAYLHGEFVNLGSGCVYYGFNVNQHLVDLPTPPHAIWGAGQDHNVDPLATVVFWRTDNHIHFVDELELSDADTQLACRELREKWGHTGLKEIFPDPTSRRRTTNSPGGLTDFDYIKAAGFRVRARNTSVKVRDRQNQVNNLLQKGMMTLGPRCKKLRKYLLTLTYENQRAPEGKKMSHLIDAMGYPIVYVWPPRKSRMIESASRY